MSTTLFFSGSMTSTISTTTSVELVEVAPMTRVHDTRFSDYITLSISKDELNTPLGSFTHDTQADPTGTLDSTEGSYANGSSDITITLDANNFEVGCFIVRSEPKVVPRSDNVLQGITSPHQRLNIYA